MANENQIPFDINQATSIVPIYEGSADDLEAFIGALTATAVKFVEKRLTKRARLGLGNKLKTLQEMSLPTDVTIIDPKTDLVIGDHTVPDWFTSYL